MLRHGIHSATLVPLAVFAQMQSSDSNKGGDGRGEARERRDIFSLEWEVCFIGMTYSLFYLSSKGGF